MTASEDEEEDSGHRENRWRRQNAERAYADCQEYDRDLAAREDANAAAKLKDPRWGVILGLEGYLHNGRKCFERNATPEQRATGANLVRQAEALQADTTPVVSWMLHLLKFVRQFFGNPDRPGQLVIAMDTPDQGPANGPDEDPFCNFAKALLEVEAVGNQSAAAVVPIARVYINQKQLWGSPLASLAVSAAGEDWLSNARCQSTRVTVDVSQTLVLLNSPPKAQAERQHSMPPAPVAEESTAAKSAQQPVPDVTKTEAAIGALAAHPDWTIKQIAEHVGIRADSLSKSRRFKTAWRAAKGEARAQRESADEAASNDE